MATEADKLTNAAVNSDSSLGANPNITMDRIPTDADGSDTASLAATSTLDGKQKDVKDSKVDATVGAATDNNSPVSDTQKKIRRAERFGMPVQLSENEKRNSRAERFGTTATLQVSEEKNNSEDLKRKARAERFGLPASSTHADASSTHADDELKKKARLARFGTDTKTESKSDSKTNSKAGSKTDAVEEDKRKARALRFSKANSDSPSELNGKGDIEQKAAIAGKAVGKA